MAGHNIDTAGSWDALDWTAVEAVTRSLSHGANELLLEAEDVIAEEKTGGKIIHRAGGVVYLFRGRNYNHKTRPRFPLMLWKPAAPIYPKLIEPAPGGLTKREADAFRKKGQHLLSICKLAKNGVYIDLVSDVKAAFEENELVRINCEGMHPSDYKKIGAKLKVMTDE